MCVDRIIFSSNSFSFVLNDILTHQLNVHVNFSIGTQYIFVWKAVADSRVKNSKSCEPTIDWQNFTHFWRFTLVSKHTDHGLNCIIFVYTSALERQALCKGVRHWLSLVLTLALPFVIKTSTISAYPIKAAACKGDLFSESRLLTASGSFSRISSTSSMLPAIMACTRGGWKIQKSISVIWWNSIIVFFVILTSNFKSVILVKSGDKTSTDPLLLPAWARPQKF